MAVVVSVEDMEYTRHAAIGILRRRQGEIVDGLLEGKPWMLTITERGADIAARRRTFAKRLTASSTLPRPRAVGE